MSPEQARGKPVDKRADIWAFGVVLFEMLTGRPLSRARRSPTRWPRCSRTSPTGGARRPTTPRGVATAARCLERDPKNRLHDIGDARIELNEACAEPLAGPTVVPAPSPPPLLRLPITIGARAMAVTSSLAKQRTPPHDRSTSPVRFKSRSPGLRRAHPSPRFSPDGRRIVFERSLPSGACWSTTSTPFESRPLPGTEGAIQPFLSPDGTWIGFPSKRGSFARSPLDGAYPVDICDQPQGTPGGAWGPGDQILFSPAWTKRRLWHVNAGGGPPAELTRLDRAKGETGHFWPDFLPDGRAVLFTIFGGKGLVDSKVGLLDLETRRYEALFEGAAPSYLALRAHPLLQGPAPIAPSRSTPRAGG